VSADARGQLRPLLPNIHARFTMAMQAKQQWFEQLFSTLRRGDQRTVRDIVDHASEAAAKHVLGNSGNVIATEVAMHAAAAGNRPTERIAEKIADSVAERAVESASGGSARFLKSRVQAAVPKAAGDAGKVIFERGSHIGAEVAGERILERSVEAVGELQLDRAWWQLGSYTECAKPIKKWGWKGGNSPSCAEVTPLPALSYVTSALRMLRVLVVVAGTGMVLHMAHHDWHRCVHEWRATRRIASTALFLVATLCDLTDVMVHLLVLLSHIAMNVDHHTLHSAETVGMGAALCSIFAVIAGEVISPATHVHGNHDQGHQDHATPPAEKKCMHVKEKRE